MTFQRFEAGNVLLQSGRTFRNMHVAYRTYGRLNADKSNVIVYPTPYGAHHTDIEYMIGPDAALDSDRYFIVIPDLFGNGLSSSPSNTPWPDTGDRYPHVTVYDAVHIQRRMLQTLWGIERVALVYGFSMGAMQAYHWGALFPDAVERIAVVCGAARCAPHNRVFIEGIEAALTADPAWRDGVFTEKPLRGLRAMGRIYAGWALSQTWYRNEQWRELGFSSLEDFLIHGWEGHFSKRDPSDLLAQFWTWKHADISSNALYGGDLAAALSAIQAKVLLMPGDHDLYFRVADSENELPYLRDAKLLPIPSTWGHRAGNPTASKEDRAFIEAAVEELLAH
jgi:homoserine O-acetyltransferase/O-succinyltransferase